MRPDIVNWRQHWEFGESGSVILRAGTVPPDQDWTIVANKTAVTVQMRSTILNDRETARYLATRILEAVALAEAQEFADLIPKEGYE